MSNPELFAQLHQLSAIEKFQMVQFLMAELAEEEELKAFNNSAVYRLWSPLDYDDADRKLTSLLEQEESRH